MPIGTRITIEDTPEVRRLRLCEIASTGCWVRLEDGSIAVTIGQYDSVGWVEVMRFNGEGSASTIRRGWDAVVEVLGDVTIKVNG